MLSLHSQFNMNIYFFSPIVIIDTAEETLFNDSNNNQHRELKPKYSGHHEYIPVMEEDDPFPSVMFIDNQPEEVVPPTKIPIKHPSEEPPPIPAAHVANLEEPEPNSVNSDVIIEAVENGTAVDMDAVEHEADKNQVQVAGDGLEEEKTTTTATTTNDNEPIVLEKHSTDDVVDQLTSDTVDDSETMMHPVATEEDVGSMEIDTDVKELLQPAEEDTPAGDVTDDDVDLLAVVGDSVESDFEELIKAQLEQFDEDNSEQIQQIHERIIVGIERSSTSSEDEEHEGKQSEMLVMVQQEVMSEVKKDVGEQSGEIEENVPAMDIPDGSVEASETPSADEQHVENNQGECLVNKLIKCFRGFLSALTVCDSCLVNALYGRQRG